MLSNFLIPTISASLTSLLIAVIFIMILCRRLANRRETNMTMTTTNHSKEFEQKNEAKVRKAVSKMTGVEQLIITLKSHGVEYLFALTGTDVYRILVEADAQGIRVIDVRHEATAVYAAQATGRMTGHPGIVVVTAGAGVVNIISGAMEAKLDEVPVVIFGGAPATTERGIGALHDLGDVMALMRPSCKQVFSVEKTSQMIPIVRKAFQISMSDTPGPVFVQLPKDVLAPYVSTHPDVRTLSIVDQLYEGPTQFLTKGIDNFRESLFSRWGHGDDADDTSPLPVHVPKASQFEIKTSSKILESAKTPLICIGAQVTLSPHRLAKVSEALESLGIPCYLKFTAKGLLGKSNDLLVQYDVESALALADVVILAGLPCDTFFNYGLDLPKNGKMITVGRNKETLTLNVPEIWRPTQVVHGDVGRYLVELSKMVAQDQPKFVTDQNWIKKCQAISLKKQRYYEKNSEVNPGPHLNPFKILFELDSVAPQDVIYVKDAGDFAYKSADLLRPPRPLSFIGIGPYANVGAALGNAVGIKVASPEATVWLVTGDGGVGFHIMELDTCSRHNIDILALVGNDAAWYEVERKQIKEFDGNTVGSALTYANYHKVAIALGAGGILVDRSDNGGENDGMMIAKQFMTAQKMNKLGSSVLVNALMTNIEE